MILAPIVRGRKGEYRKELEKLAQDGYVRVRINGELFPLDDPPQLDKRKNHTIEVVVDRLLVKQGIAGAAGAVHRHGAEAGFGTGDRCGRRRHRACLLRKTGVPRLRHFSVPQLEPRSFSFNSPYGACPACNGLGSKYDFDPAKVIMDWTRPLFDGGLGPGSGSAFLKRTSGTRGVCARIRSGYAVRKVPAQSAKPDSVRLSAVEQRTRHIDARGQAQRQDKGFRFSGSFEVSRTQFRGIRTPIPIASG